MNEVVLKVCPVHGPVSLNALTCPRPVSANNPKEPQETNACGIRLQSRKFKMLPDIPSE